MSDPLGNNKQCLSRILESGVVVPMEHCKLFVKTGFTFIRIPLEAQIMLFYIFHTIKTQFHKSHLNDMGLFNSYPSLIHTLVCEKAMEPTL